MSSRKPFHRLSPARVVPAAAIAAVLAITLVVAPSFAGSVLTPKKAAGIYISSKEAKRIFFTKKDAGRYYDKSESNSRFLQQKQASKTYVAKADLPAVPVVAVNSTSVDFGPVSSTTPTPVPSSDTTIVMPETGFVTMTFSGQATCTADTNGLGCPFEILVNGQPTNRVNLATASSATPAAKPAVRSYTQSTVLTEGENVISLQYVGAPNASVSFGLTDWNLVVTGYPGSLDN